MTSSFAAELPAKAPAPYICLLSSSNGPIRNYLIEGISGTGKTSVAKNRGAAATMRLMRVTVKEISLVLLYASLTVKHHMGD